MVERGRGTLRTAAAPARSRAPGLERRFGPATTFVRRSRLASPAEEVFRWHARPGALERLTPPWERVERVAGGESLEPGSRVVLRARVGPLARTWVAEHTDLEPGRRFRDVQSRGPFARWEHTHSMLPLAGGGCELEDRVEVVLAALGEARQTGRAGAQHVGIVEPGPDGAARDADLLAALDPHARARASARSSARAAYTPRR